MNRRALFTIFTIVFTDILGFGILIPLLPVISQNLGIQGFSLGLLVSSYALAQFISSPLLGNLSDKYGRKPILVISKLGTVIAYLIFAFSHSFILLLLSRLIDGFTGGNIPAARAYISDVTSKENRPKGMALIGIAFGLGFIIGPALGGFFYSLSGSFTLPALIGALLCFLSLVLTVLFLRESIKPQTTPSRSFKLKTFLKILNHPVIKKILFTQFILSVVLSGFQTTLAFFTAKLFFFNPQQNSYLFIYLGLLGLLIQGYFAKNSLKNNYRATSYGLIFIGTGLILISLSPSLVFVFLFLAINSFGGSLVGIYLPTLLSTVDSHDPEGEIMGAYEGVSSLGRVIGPALTASLVVNFPRLVYFLLGLLIIVSSRIILKPLPKQNPKHVTACRPDSSQNS